MKKINDAVSSLSEFLMRENCDNNNVFQVYNNWVRESGYVIKDESIVQFFLKFIKDFNQIDKNLLNASIKFDNGDEKK